MMSVEGLLSNPFPSLLQSGIAIFLYLSRLCLVLPWAAETGTVFQDALGLTLTSFTLRVTLLVSGFPWCSHAA